MHLEQGDRLVLEDGRVAEGRRGRGRADGGDGARRAPPRANSPGTSATGTFPHRSTTHRILLRRDRIIRAMLEQLGATVRDVTEPFTPEHGAYHSHDH